MEQYNLTTVDNPFNPFENFKEWFLFDVEKGYNSCSMVDRVANLSDGMSETEEILERNRAIDRIIEIDPLGVYTKVVIPIKSPDDNE